MTQSRLLIIITLWVIIVFFIGATIGLHLGAGLCR